MPTEQPRGYFQKLLAFDSETTGLCFSNDNPVHNVITGERHQAISWGFIIADSQTFEPIDELYVEVQWNEESIRQRNEKPHFGTAAEKVHGLTREHLTKNGVSEEEAVVQFANFIMPHFGTDGAIKTLGHNSITFDLPFLKDMIDRVGVDIRFGNRHYCSASIGLMYDVYNSDDLFSLMGYDERHGHNALDDAHMTLDVFRQTKQVFKSILG